MFLLFSLTSSMIHNSQLMHLHALNLASPACMVLNNNISVFCNLPSVMYLYQMPYCCKVPKQNNYIHIISVHIVLASSEYLIQQNKQWIMYSRTFSTKICYRLSLWILRRFPALFWGAAWPYSYVNVSCAIGHVLTATAFDTTPIAVLAYLCDSLPFTRNMYL